LETTLHIECFEPLIGFLAYLVQKLWPRNNKLINPLINQLSIFHCFQAITFEPEMLVLQPLWWRCVERVIHHERDVREEQQYICGANKQ